MEFFLNVSLNYWRGWPHKVKVDLKMKVHGLCLWDCGLSFPRNLGGKSRVTLLGKISSGKSDEFFLKFRHFFPWRIFSKENCPQWKFFPMKNFTCRTQFSKWKLKLTSRQSFRNYVLIVHMVEDLWVLEWLTLLIKKYLHKCVFITADKFSAGNGKVAPVSWAFVFWWIFFPSGN